MHQCKCKFLLDASVEAITPPSIICPIVRYVGTRRLGLSQRLLPKPLTRLKTMSHYFCFCVPVGAIRIQIHYFINVVSKSLKSDTVLYMACRNHSGDRVLLFNDTPSENVCLYSVNVLCYVMLLSTY